VDHHYYEAMELLRRAKAELARLRNALPRELGDCRTCIHARAGGCSLPPGEPGDDPVNWWREDYLHDDGTRRSGPPCPEWTRDS
jgi:hypothetical protein